MTSVSVWFWLYGADAGDRAPSVLEGWQGVARRAISHGGVASALANQCPEAATWHRIRRACQSLSQWRFDVANQSAIAAQGGARMGLETLQRIWGDPVTNPALPARSQQLLRVRCKRTDLEL